MNGILVNMNGREGYNEPENGYREGGIGYNGWVIGEYEGGEVSL